MCVLILQALLCMCPHTTALHFLLHSLASPAALLPAVLSLILYALRGLSSYRAATHTLYTLPHTSATICVLILLLQYMCPHTTASLACFTFCSTSGCTVTTTLYCYICPHTSATICVLILLLPYMCPHTAALLACFTCCSTSGCTLADCKLN